MQLMQHNMKEIIHFAYSQLDVAEGRVFLLVPAYAGCPRTKAVKQLLLLLLSVRRC